MTRSARTLFYCAGSAEAVAAAVDAVHAQDPDMEPVLLIPRDRLPEFRDLPQDKLPLAGAPTWTNPRFLLALRRAAPDRVVVVCPPRCAMDGLMRSLDLLRRPGRRYQVAQFLNQNHLHPLSDLTVYSANYVPAWFVLLLALALAAAFGGLAWALAGPRPWAWPRSWLSWTGA